MFAITPLGSCRIATPLRLMRADYGYAVNRDRVYGFCHSSAEAVQMMRYLHGEIEIDPEIAPLIMRRAPEEAAVHRPADLYVIELCSSKTLRIDRHVIQLNYLTSAHAAFFSEPSRTAAFWRAVATEDQASIDEFLDTAWSATQAQRDEACLLRRIRRSETTAADLRRDVRQLMQALPATLFVTHVDALTPAGTPIASRSRFIAMVEAAVAAEGGLVYNPTAAMQEMGQRLAIEDHSDSLAHFTEDFCRIVFQDWFDLAIAPRMDALARAADEAQLNAVLTPHVRARLGHGDAALLASRLETLAEARPGSTALNALLVETHAALGNTENALNRLDAMPRPVAGPEAIGLLRQRAELAMELGRYHDLEAVLLALDALGAAPAWPQLAQAARSLDAVGQRAGAVRLYALALARQIEPERAAQEILALGLAEAAERDPGAGRALLDLLAPGQAERMRGLLAPADAWRLAHLTDDRAAREAFLEQPPALDGAAFEALLDAVESADGRACAATLIARRRRAEGREKLTDPILHARVERWFATLEPTADPDAALDVLLPVLTAAPLHQQARIQLREVRRTLVAAMRRAYEAANLQALDALAPTLARLPDPVADYDLLRMRLLFSRGGYAAAIDAARKVTRTDPDHLPAWVIAMRAAARSQDLDTLEEATARVLALVESDEDGLAEEAALRRTRLPTQAFRAAKDAADPLEALRLLRLARRDPGLAEAVGKRRRRIETQLARQIRARETDPDARFEQFAEEAVALLPDNVPIRLAMGRFLMRRRAFDRALPHWEQLARHDPDNETFAARRDRCRALATRHGARPG